MLDLLFYIFLHTTTSVVVIAFLFHIILHDKKYLNAEHTEKLLTKHKEIYAAIYDLFQNSQPIDLLTVSNQLKTNAKLELA